MLAGSTEEHQEEQRAVKESAGVADGHPSLSLTAMAPP